MPRRVFAAALLAVVLVAGCSGRRPPERRNQRPRSTPSAIVSTPTPTQVVTPATGSGGKFVCTQVIGFSQTEQWYLRAPDFESIVGDDRWQLQWNAGAGLELWANPGYVGWSEPILSPCAQNSDDPDRIVFTIASHLLPKDDPGPWVQDIHEVVGILRMRFPDAREIVLQSIVGGPGGETCLSRQGVVVDASAMYPVVVQAIHMAAEGDVIVGDAPVVRSCEDYQDFLGHLTLEAAGPIGAQIARFYAGR